MPDVSEGEANEENRTKERGDSEGVRQDSGFNVLIATCGRANGFDRALGWRWLVSAYGRQHHWQFMQRTYGGLYALSRNRRTEIVAGVVADGWLILSFYWTHDSGKEWRQLANESVMACSPQFLL